MKDTRMLTKYRNGNYAVMMGYDGTKIRLCAEGTYKPKFPEIVELRVTNRCDVGCPYCYDNASPNGLHGDILNDSFIKSIPKGVEVEISGGNPMTHPNLCELITTLHSNGCPVCLVLNQKHFMDNYDAVEFLCENDFVYRVKASSNEPTPEFISAVKRIDRVFVSVITGVINRPMLERLYDKQIKLFICGYRKFRRGATYYLGDVGVLLDARTQWLSDSFDDIVKHFDVVELDRNAVKMLVQDTSSISDAVNMLGKEGEFNMFVDCVGKKFGSDVSAHLEKYDHTKDTIFDMFNKIQEVHCNV